MCRPAAEGFLVKSVQGARMSWLDYLMYTTLYTYIAAFFLLKQPMFLVCIPISSLFAMLYRVATCWTPVSEDKM